MTPEQWLLDEAVQWVRRAEADLRATAMLTADLPGEALFHTWRQVPFRKTHELRELGRACAELDPTLGSALEPSYALSEYAWKFRYPGAPYEADPVETARGQALAEGVKEEILRRLPPGGRPNSSASASSSMSD